MKTITIQVPDGCEVQIVRKEEKKEPVIRTYQDLIDNKDKIEGHWFRSDGEIIPYISIKPNGYSKVIPSSEKVAKSMLAMAMISQLLPFYGGVITDEEWSNGELKYMIQKVCNKIKSIELINTYYFLAFHTAEQRDNFLKYNEQLVKDYLMID